ncbi:RICIN domain-containing protein [Streptomyces sp. NPDC050504]|uniref:RICIN domain-containing protein n=1 Tax=Streptomyces sp. NPDC050504 TaxID=3365618 RepID=UPI00378D9136
MRVRRGIIGAVATAGASVLLVTGTTTSANAAEIKQYRNAQTGLCLDSNANGSVYTKQCGSDNPYQKWERRYEDGVLRLRNLKTGRCLSKAGGGSKITTQPCVTDGTQQWLEEKANGTTRITGYAFPNGTLVKAAVDSNAKGDAYLKEYGPDNPYQQWYE